MYAGGNVNGPADLKRNLLYVLIAEATNMGLGAMAESCGVPHDVLGAVRRTVYAARYLADETYRRRIARQLNRGENLHTLRRSLAYAAEGALRRRHDEQQTEQMWCLTLAINAIVCWSTECHGLAIGALRRDGRGVGDELLAHIWPTHHENVHFYGTHSVDIDGELAQLDADGYRPLRMAPAADTGRGGPVALP